MTTMNKITQIFKLKDVQNEYGIGIIFMGNEDDIGGLCEFINNEQDQQMFSKKVKLTIEVLEDEKETEEEPTVGIKLAKVVKIDRVCEQLGVNPWCVSEGADGDELIQVPVSLAIKENLI